MSQLKKLIIFPMSQNAGILRKKVEQAYSALSQAFRPIHTDV